MVAINILANQNSSLYLNIASIVINFLQKLVLLKRLPDISVQVTKYHLSGFFQKGFLIGSFEPTLELKSR